MDYSKINGAMVVAAILAAVGVVITVNGLIQYSRSPQAGVALLSVVAGLALITIGLLRLVIAGFEHLVKLSQNGEYDYGDADEIED